MSRTLFLLTAAAAMLSGPALAIGPASNNAVPGAQAPATNSSCDGCASPQSGQTDQTGTAQSGSATGPIINPTTPRPAHTQTPSHMPQPGGAAPKGADGR